MDNGLFFRVWTHVPRQRSEHLPRPERTADFVLTLLSVIQPQLTTLRGSVLEDAVPSTSKHGTTRGLPVKDVLEHLLPELDLPCLRLALNTPKVTEQLMKLDEQGVGCTWDPPQNLSP